MNTPSKLPTATRHDLFERFVLPALSRNLTYVIISAAILLIDLFTGRYLLFPFLFILPVAFSAWYGKARLAYLLAVMLPADRFLISVFWDAPYPLPLAISNTLIRIAVLVLFAYLVSRMASQSRELERKVDDFITMCAWSHTIEFKGEWLSFEEYMKRRFNIITSHGISPEQARKVFGELKTNAPTN